MLPVLLSLHFNSIKVRLKLTENYPFLAVNTLFQFHKGTIKTFVRFWFKLFKKISIP